VNRITYLRKRDIDSTHHPSHILYFCTHPLPLLLSHQVEHFFHPLQLQLVQGPAVTLYALPQVRAELEAVYPPTIITNQNHRLRVIEGDVGQLGLLYNLKTNQINREMWSEKQIKN
jgi:hypothetical protein